MVNISPVINQGILNIIILVINQGKRNISPVINQGMLKMSPVVNGILMFVCLFVLLGESASFVHQVALGVLCFLEITYLLGFDVSQQPNPTLRGSN